MGCCVGFGICVMIVVYVMKFVVVVRKSLVKFVCVRISVLSVGLNIYVIDSIVCSVVDVSLCCVLLVMGSIVCVNEKICDSDMVFVLSRIVLVVIIGLCVCSMYSSVKLSVVVLSDIMSSGWCCLC